MTPTPTATPVAVAPVHVVDEAGLLGRDAAALDGKLAAFERRTGQRVIVYTAVSLNGHSEDEVIEAVGNRLGVSKGAILMLAPKERVARIAVGPGARKLLTDAEATRILKETMWADLHANRFAPAIQRGADRIMAELSETVA